jgi:ribosome maturation factor RimP
MVIKGPRTGLELRFYELTSKIVSENNLVLYDMQWHAPSGNLTVFIMNAETKSAVLDDCVKVDRAFNPYMESEDWIPENFTLEVSSPGLYRTLSSVEHFQAVVGEDILIQLASKIDEEKYLDFPKAMRNNLKLKVKLQEVLGSGIKVDAKGCLIEVPFEQIKKANLETDLSNVKE